MTRVRLAVNGVQLDATLEPRTSLADFLRLHRHLTGTHLGCEHGVCGACTIMLNGKPARSCISLAVSLDGASVRTIEGFDDDRVMATLREAFHEEHALQCGFCTAGMLVTARDIVGRLAEADEKRIRVELAGNLCRCTGYVGIVNAIQRVMREVPATVRMGAVRGRGAPAPRPAGRPFQAFVAKSATPRLAESAEARLSLEAVPALEKSWSRIIDHIFVARPRAEVWAFLSDVRRVAPCMPGAEFASDDGHTVEGCVRVAFGPIKVTFAGSATIERNDADMVGVISGMGGDEQARSRVKGRVSYVVLEAIGTAAGTRVELVLDYQLQGPLAQFARTGLVRAFASQMIAEFAANLSAALAGGPVERAPSASSLGAGSVLWRTVVAQLKHWVRWAARH